MKDKRGLPTKKDDDNPFAGYLYEDEKILWMDGALTRTTGNGIKTYAYVSLVSLILWIIVISQSYNAATAASTGGACIFLIFVVGLLIVRPVLQAKRIESSTSGVYALTDRHLFYWDGSQVIERHLRDVPSIQLVQGVASQGTLSFGDDFPAMPNIDDAAYVKTMIEQAQKHRLEGDHS